MELEQALRTYLLTKTGLTALVSTRIALDEIADGMALPAIIYFKVSDVKAHTHEGLIALNSPVFQFSIYATTPESARAINVQLQTALNDYKGTLSGLVIQYITLLSENSSVETPAEGTGRVFIDDLEYQIHFVKE